MEHQQHGSTQQPRHLKNKRKENYDQLLELEIEKTKSQLECLAKETDGRKGKQESNVVAKREMISLQRERLQLKKFKLEIETERSLHKVRIEKEEIGLEREKAKLKLDQLQIQKAELEVVQLQHAVIKCLQLIKLCLGFCGKYIKLAKHSICELVSLLKYSC